MNIEFIINITSPTAAGFANFYLQNVISPFATTPPPPNQSSKALPS